MLARLPVCPPERRLRLLAQQVRDGGQLTTQHAWTELRRNGGLQAVRREPAARTPQRSLAIQNARLEREQVEQTLRADLSNLWQAYRNNLELLGLERQNVIAARDNHEIAMERYMLGDLSGIEMREAQKSLLDAEERILSAQYDTKMCEISLLQISGKVLEYME